MFADSFELWPPKLMVAEPGGTYRAATEREVLYGAESLLHGKIRERPIMTTPQDVKTFLRARMGALDHEEFGVLHLDSRHALIAVETLFRGTINETVVYPRVVVKQALAHNAAAVIFCHNHPSGDCEPSRADKALTETLKAALKLVDISVLDHFVVSRTDVASMAGRGLV